MKKCGRCQTIRSRDEFTSYKKSSDGLRPWCRECTKTYNSAYRASHKGEIAASKKDWAKRQPTEYAKRKRERLEEMHPGYKRIESAKRRAANPEKYREANKKWREQNKTKVRQLIQVSRRKNPALYASLLAKRRALKLRATPSWASSKKIQEFYDTADGLNMLLGCWHHVDHIVPLVSTLVCGLHCEANLQVLPATENIRKSNRIWPDMP